MPNLDKMPEHERRSLIEPHPRRRERAPRVVRVQVTNLHRLVLWGAVAFLAYKFFDAIAVTVLLFAVAFFLALILEPPIRWLDRRGLKRGQAVAIIALTFLGLVGLACWLAIPPLIEQVSDYVRNAPRYADQLQGRAEVLSERVPFLKEQLESVDVGKQLSQVGKNILPQVGRYSLNLLGGVFSALIVFIIALYTVAAPGPLVKGVIGALPRQHRRTGLRVLARTTTQLQAWVKATFLLMLFIGVLSGVAMWVLKVPNALLFGVIAGIGEAIPTIGPILSAIPPILVTVGDDPQKAGYVALAFLIIQQVENNLLVPRIMAQSLDLHSVSVMFWVIAMGALMGPLGILLATPVCVIVKVVYQEVYRRRVQREPIPRPDREPGVADVGPDAPISTT